ncbi:MAG: GHKL domain-containing protein [Nitrospirae bacterium]|nr:GHKL domain-containing protein [Nitrospirota bacterium]
MSLKKKIILGFLTSSIIIVVLMIFAFASFMEIRKEIHYLELSDNLRSKSLQLRRHEKNFFLYMDAGAVEKVHANLKELQALLNQGRRTYNNEELLTLGKKIDDYGQKFNHIETIFTEIQKQLTHLKPKNSQYSALSQIIETTFLERPLVNAELLKSLFSLREENPIIKNLQELNTEMTAIRKDGEEILTISNDMDKSAREKVDKAIAVSQTTALILFPMFIFVGLWALFGISQSTVRRLRILSGEIEKTGLGNFSSVAEPTKNWGTDEVGLLIGKFNYMEEQLAQRERELLQSKKLAAIGTLASGVAHELNNPLNNIYTTAQRLIKKSGEECPPFIKNGLDDIFAQTMRVKKIVSDLLEFARGKEPQPVRIELNTLIANTYKLLPSSLNTANVRFLQENEISQLFISADPEQMEQVFINLFSNAIEAMSGKGDLTVKTITKNNNIIIKISDAGKGIPQEAIDKIFEPFFTTKEKGTGLGLAIVFNIIQKHHGDIQVDSQEGRGTTFIITLPAGKEN